MTQLRPVRAVSLAGLSPVEPVASAPVLEIAHPADLLIEEQYQRALSERSITLIRRVISEWDWRRFTPPRVARIEAGLVVLDGQHTAIAAASHPLIDRIPVLVVDAAAIEDRAKAFIGINRDRLQITKTQLHFAAGAAGDEDAQTIDQVCSRAGITILRNTPGNGIFKPRETVAVGALGQLVKRRHAMGARKVLEVIAAADAAPISERLIKAVDVLMHDDEYCNDVAPEDITTALIALGDAADHEAKVFAATHKVPIWKALAITIFRKAKRRVRRAS